MAADDVRKGMPSANLDKESFAERFRAWFFDPAFAALKGDVDRLLEVAWDAYDNSRKAPLTHPAGPSFADPSYDLSDEWRSARDMIAAAEQRQKAPDARRRILLINASPRSEHTCPGEMSKSYRLASIAQEIFAAEPGFDVELLDLSRLASEYGRRIFPCKSCVSTAMPLCHWPCSCYPNHSLGQTGDWMAEIYPMWVAAHGVMIVTPVHWYQAPTTLKAMIDRLVCADGGNPDPSSTSGKNAAKAKAIEEKGWDFPRHLAGRLYALAVHGDAAGAGAVRRALGNWLSDIGLQSAGPAAELDRYIGYYGRYSDSHHALDEDGAIQRETANAARALVDAVKMKRAGRYDSPGAGLSEPRPK